MINDQIEKFKEKLAKEKKLGLALDMDETLSFTIGYLIEELIKKLGSPENLTAYEMARKYKHTDNIPYWQKDEANKIISEIISSNEVQQNLPLIENADRIVKEINKIIPIVAYITVRSESVIDGTRFWLEKHGFPKAEIIAKPMEIARKDGNEWKAKTLEYLYPQVLGIVDDNPGLTKFFTKDYKGTVYLYDNEEKERKDIKIIPCKDWEMVAKKIKESVK